MFLHSLIPSGRELAQDLFLRLESVPPKTKSRPHLLTRKWKTALLMAGSRKMRRRSSLIPLTVPEAVHQLEVLFQRTSTSTILMRLINPTEVTKTCKILLDVVFGSLYSACTAHFVKLAFEDGHMGLFKKSMSISHFIRRAAKYSLFQFIAMIDKKHKHFLKEEDPATNPYSELLTYHR